MHNNPSRARAVVRDAYGPVDSVEIRDVEIPPCASDQVVVEVRAAALNPLDWHTLTGTPLVMRIGEGWTPRSNRLGSDAAGVVVEIGSDVTDTAVGDEVFGVAPGALGDRVQCDPAKLAHKPDSVSFEDAAAVPVGALTALQALRDHGAVRPGHRVLINGASGGVGTFAIQLAKHLGAEVTGVCSGPNVSMVESLGADHVVDYTREDFTSAHGAYDVVLDCIGNQPLRNIKRCLVSQGVYVVVGAPKSPVFGPLWHMAGAKLAFLFDTRRAAVFIADANRPDLEHIAELLWSGVVRVVIDRVLPLEQCRQGLEALESGRTRGKIVLLMS
jgi:NADPH:quinone reductase-like Zn-dependent oxidoreductase